MRHQDPGWAIEWVNVPENFQPLYLSSLPEENIAPLAWTLFKGLMWGQCLTEDVCPPQVLYLPYCPIPVILDSITGIKPCPGINGESLSLVWIIHQKPEEPLYYVMTGYWWDYSYSVPLRAVQNIRQDKGDLLKIGQPPVIQNSVFSQGPVMTP